MLIKVHKILGSLPGFCGRVFISYSIYCYTIIMNRIIDGTMEAGNHLVIAANWRKMLTKRMLSGAHRIYDIKQNKSRV